MIRPNQVGSVVRDWNAKAARGDQIVEVQVETPTNLTKKQKDLLTQFADAGDTSPETDSFLKRVRRIWADDS